MGKKISLIGASNLHTNSTCNFGSMAGLALTSGWIRPKHTALPGYKYTKTQNDASHYQSGCGAGKSCASNTNCLKTLKLYNGSHQRYDTVRGKYLG